MAKAKVAAKKKAKAKGIRKVGYVDVRNHAHGGVRYQRAA